MKVAVTDACIFIDLIELDLISLFFKLEIEMHTTVEVMGELYQEQKQVLAAYQAEGKLQVHNLGDEEFLEMKKIPFPRGLSFQDQSVIYLAKKIGGAIVLISDKLVRDFAGTLHLPFHGIFWILDLLVEMGIQSKNQAIQTLTQMHKINSMYQVGLMKKEIEKRIQLWGS